MPYRDTRYFINTIFLKTNAQFWDWANRTSLLDAYKKRTQTFFAQEYTNNFSERKLDINHSFSKKYATYNFFSKTFDLEQHLRFSNQGVALCHLDAKKKHENPLLPAYFGLVCYNDFLLNKDGESLQKFWIQIHFLETLGELRGNAILFLYDGLKAPWFSGITQGLIASTFIRAFDLSKINMYKIKARQTIEAMFIPLENGGVFCKTPEGFDWIEEYPSVPKLEMVLNGFIFSIIAVYEYLIFCGEDAALEKRLEHLVESLFNTLYHFIRGSFVKYSRFNKAFQNINYQGLIVFLFLHLYELSGNKSFRDIAIKFNENVDWAAYFRFHKMTHPQYFEDNFL